ncbi:MAG: hypothetical protein KatS3mg038_2162 [Candidatus Kapaibacterium sp.]|nr:MAG: hypothetical protein KatS3mg038_2162 [Candidatus Kapabacteria bacterium]
MDLLKAPKLPVVSSLPSASSDRAGELVYYNGVVYLCDGTKWTPLTKEFPVGSILITVDNNNPATWLGYGTWSQFAQGRCLVGVDTLQTEFNAPLKTGGAKTHTLSLTEIPPHTHSYTRYSVQATVQSGTGSVGIWRNALLQDTSSAGGGQPHNNLQPYIVVYFWRRIA